ncbi:UDP-glucose dehydrogenase family protein [Azospirillum brasilense]|uniref:UDP-glucose 6-dehydrogenase n=1 Tax=Azospirillum brasilense TaxID=192 RepID=A0A6L3AV62_AZOBR|nr:UDP-glucose/GDP-mannose dehydrogenase family protein [Azospirillum brasilense]KAA0679935.1 UDP-glucose/GDP-mannose dehydrogenase family protein [Azospirillum brasilense]
MRIAVVGTGYVGLVSGACFAEFGIDVCCVDKDETKIRRLRGGEIPIYEPGLDVLVARNMAADRLSFTSDLAVAMEGADVVLIAVGTPSRPGDGGADLTYVHAAAAEIARTMSRYTVIVTKSTVPVGTGRQIAALVRDINPRAEFDVVSNPEFLREGSAIGDFMQPDRVVIGADSERAQAVMDALYQPLIRAGTPFVRTGIETAELTKYSANAFLAFKITFINEVADLCERVGADVQDVAEGMGMDGRIGRPFLNAGPGFGGSCFPKDTEALVRTGRQHGAPVRLIETVVDVNRARKRLMAGRILQACGPEAAGKRIAVLGITFKPDTNDMREAASLEIIPLLQEAGATVHVYDPAGMDEGRHLLPGVVWHDDAYAPLAEADCVAILTEWNEFRALDLGRVRSLMRRPVMVDLRNVYAPAAMAAAGFHYCSVGRRDVRPDAAKRRKAAEAMLLSNGFAADSCVLPFSGQLAAAASDLAD